MILVSLYPSSRTNLKLHNISVTPKMVKKVITNFDSSKASDPDCIPVVFQRNSDPELLYILAELFNMCLKVSCPDCWKVSSVVLAFIKNFLVSIMVLGLFDQLQIFRQLHLIELLGLLTDLGPIELSHLIYPRLLAGFGMLVFFRNVSLMEFQVKDLALFLLFSVIDGFRWFWMGNIHKNIQLMLEFLKGPFLVLHFFYYTLMTFLMMLSVILLSMLMILLSILSVIRHLICGNN